MLIKYLKKKRFNKYKKNIKKININVIKLKLDLNVRKTKGHKQFSNNLKGFKQIVSWISKQKKKLCFT